MALQDTDCSICLQKFVHPVKLPCGHIFCFLCIKGCSFHRKRCPICRGRFSQHFFDDPQLLTDLELSAELETTGRNSRDPQRRENTNSHSYKWFYEGYAGWWQYDERTSDELEEAYNKKLSSIDVTVAGFVYTIDFSNMTQVRKDLSGRRRRIKRDLSNCEKKGIAGIKITSFLPRESSSQSHSSNTTDSDSRTHNQESSVVTTSTRSRSTCPRSSSSAQPTQPAVQSDSPEVTTVTPMSTRARTRAVPNPAVDPHPRPSRSLSRSRLGSN